jgi:hypothetical protein
MGKVIPGIKLICHNANRVNVPDDPSFPFKLEASFRPPEFMMMAFIGLVGGSEEVVIRGMTKEDLDEFVELNNLRTHPRLLHITITGPDGILEQLPQKE